MSDPFAGLEVLESLLDEVRANQLEASAGRALYAVQVRIYQAREARLALEAARLQDQLDAITGGR